VSLVVSFSTWLVTTPLVAYYFGIVSLISLVANLFVVPFTPFILQFYDGIEAFYSKGCGYGDCFPFEFSG
ncbi:MAG: ComEC/Rec2 family competence protein, partial [Candidatus Omnitrophica bacterium]|nr:ComEC/Rec2 family competence protein [Candidatus Omnitrophota bacterium]